MICVSLGSLGFFFFRSSHLSLCTVLVLAFATLGRALPAHASEELSADYVPPVHFLTEEEQAAFAHTLQTIASKGFHRIAKPKFDVAESSLDAAEILAPDDPRIPYLRALLLIRKQKRADAQKQLESAIKLSQGKYWPAAWLQIEIALAESDQARPAQLVRDLAQKVRESQPPAPPAPLREQMISKLGRLVGFLACIDSRSSINDRFHQLDVELRGQWNKDDLFLYEASFDSLIGEYEELTGELHAAGEKARAKQTDLIERETDELKVRQQTAAEEKARTEETAAELEVEFQKKIEPIDRAIGVLVEQGQLLEGKLIQQETRIGDLRELLMNYDLQLSRAATGRLPSPLVLERQALTRQRLADAQTQYRVLANQMHAIQIRGQVLLRERDKLVRSYQKATGKLAKENAELEKLTKQINHRLVENTQAVAQPKDAGEIVQRKAQAKRWQTYLKVDPSTEAERIAALYRPQADAEAEPSEEGQPVELPAPAE
jgi:transcriptional regulator NrdR family protein